MTGYFQTNRQNIDLFPGGSAQGLRVPQLGAIASIIAHGTRFEEAAVVVLPTGTGKTAVLQLTPFVWGSNRALILTPSRLVRDQIAAGFKNLRLLKDLGVLPQDLPCPRVKTVSSKICTVEDWQKYESADIVITTPMSASPTIAGISQPPSDMFDLVMVDEAHHSPAVSYASLVSAFPSARKALFTATPFRRDKKILPGKLVYSYSLKAAIEDGTYGKIEYVACLPSEAENPDAAIAKRAQHELKADRANGLDHRIMVRTDSVTRAKELVKIYEQETSLRLKLVHGQHTMRHVSEVIRKLEEGELDGVICVDMFGEGVDFPRLKIAALHAPHKSLAITLQFVGRFARTNATDLGTAKFIAIPQEIDAEVRDLFRNGANWEDLVANLSDARVDEEESVRDGLASFETEILGETDEADLTIDSLNPYFHSKVYHADCEPDWDLKPFVPRGCELFFHAVSDDLASSVMVCQRKTKPKWLTTDSLVDTKNLLIIVHYNRLNQLLFVNSQEHGEDLYDGIVDTLYSNKPSVTCVPLSHGVISRALRILNQPCFYNLGMRNRELGGQDESYRTLTGPKADRRISKTDGNTRSRGHVFGGSTCVEEPVTLGISTLSKIWSNKYGLVPRFVDWCHKLAMEIVSSDPVGTGSNLDFLDTGKRVSVIPAPAIGIVWPEHVFRYPQLLSIDNCGEDRDLTGLELVVDTESYDKVSLEFELVVDELPVAKYRFSPGESQCINRVETGPHISVRGPTFQGTLEQFLCLKPPTIFLADFSTMVGGDWYRGSTGNALNRAWIRTFDEFGKTVDIEHEYSHAKQGMKTIHEFTEAQFLSQNSDVVVYDHRTGEIADYISLTEMDDAVICELAHCKGASGKKNAKPKLAGTRVDDAYEVAGQVVKCLPFSRRPDELMAHLVRRIATGSVLKRGSVELLERILANASSKRFIYRVCLVQPGLSAASLNTSVESVLAAAGEYVMANAGTPPCIWISP